MSILVSRYVALSTFLSLFWPASALNSHHELQATKQLPERKTLCLHREGNVRDQHLQEVQRREELEAKLADTDRRLTGLASSEQEELRRAAQAEAAQKTLAEHVRKGTSTVQVAEEKIRLLERQLASLEQKVKTEEELRQTAETKSQELSREVKGKFLRYSFGVLFGFTGCLTSGFS